MKSTGFSSNKISCYYRSVRTFSVKIVYHLIKTNYLQSVLNLMLGLQSNMLHLLYGLEYYSMPWMNAMNNIIVGVVNGKIRDPQICQDPCLKIHDLESPSPRENQAQGFIIQKSELET